ncbi:aminotransferase class V-fold PLP-dependent enzyme [Geobacter sulfurreducens]|uniref:cysteine-S-conjugate beta-lyase n=1 Tax=Geobacter sulfurreducens (strain ATCC 51573 / DSM 12127 / PCA) TaxID=243231 RepID=Q74EL7_GEOSL|nr:aminotransferase class V-fold PLP-dependent enzyme [Geobacter sulfurreducens]AAR34272.1 cystathionine gamma-synthase/beta-lyase [Geobacter sulfurreducens PCA]ADI83794.1 cystathionine gamma-synthase/beta-lyase [Geobacter sulfurreducens KN400]AJY70683.1 cystathionine gamma-synthase [Geobacter sulfurreducens]QVW36188.1 aminotransferase class V-fold PLP-dependent enzyme [Geobacter sulfurreducens]UAC05001.1 aminotransferase class V-fold PLP-dependent enzyme [Geobacter sulfurreducens]
MKFGTRIIHTGREIDPTTGALSVPIYQTSTYRQESVDHFGKYDYARSDNPTREALEETVAQLENGTRGFAFASGMAAISSTLLLFSPGDHLVVCEDVYGGTFRALTQLFSRLGVESTFVDATDTAAIEAAFRPNTKGLYLETPSNPLMKITDLAAAARLARERGAITLVDNTFMTPYLQRPLDLGCDVVLHSGTKFLNGHSDVVCGFAVVRDPELGQRIRFIQNAFGAILGPQDSWLVLRGIKTLRVRMEESQAGAVKIANWLAGEKRVSRVFYPGLPDHPGHDIHGRQSSGPGAVLSFTLDTVETTRRLLEGMRLAAFAVSLGGVESIISYPARMSHAAMPPAERAARGIGDTLVRLSVGLEDADDLLAEMDRLING